LSSSFNPTGFSTTASLYTDGGLRVTRDAYISGTLYLNNVTVFGTQSVAYISSSQLNIGTNLITVNTDTPSIRFGGLAVYDSGSTGLTGSILWDSQNNHWVYSNPSGSSYSGGMFISGPRTSTLGSETGTTSCALMMGQGGDHITSSAILHYGNATCFYGTSFISSSGAACFAGSLTGSSAIFSSTLSATNLSAEGSPALGGIVSLRQDATYLPRGNGYSSIASSPSVFEFYGYTGASTYKNFTLRFDGLTNNTRREYTLPDACGTLALLSGTQAFTGTVCAPSFVGGTVSGTTGAFSSSVTATQFIVGSTSTSSDVSIRYRTDTGDFSTINDRGAHAFGIYDHQASLYRMYINTFGNVGIGTISPSQLLHLKTELETSSGVGTTIQIESGGAGGDQAWIGVNKGTGNGLEFSVENRDIIFNTGATTPFGGSERMRITSGGNVLIGTTCIYNTANFIVSAGSGASSTPYMGIFNCTSSPTSAASTRFDLGFLSGNSNFVATGTVLGYINFMGQANDAGYGGAGIYAEVVSGGNVGRGSGHGVNLIFNTKATNTVGYNERIRITSAGNVGIGTTSPNNTLTVNACCADKGIDLTINNTTTVARFGVTDPNVNNNPYIGGFSNNNFLFYSNSNVRLTLANTGEATFACQVCAPSFRTNGGFYGCVFQGVGFSTLTGGSGTGNAIFNTVTRSGAALYEVAIVANPNGAGSGAYADFYYGDLLIGTGFDGGVKDYIFWCQRSTPPRSLYGSGGGNLTVNVCMFYSGAEYSNISLGGTYTIRFKINGYNSSATGDGTTIFLKQII
jgi:hypothetical protein